MPSEDISLGEYIRRLRRAASLSLQSLAETTGISYSHLSRIENDSTIPGAQTIATLSDALGGDLKFMLETANALPRSILDRISARTEGAGALRRAVHQSQGDISDLRNWQASTAEFLTSIGLPAEYAPELSEMVRQFVQLNDERRKAVALLIQSLAKEGDEHAG